MAAVINACKLTGRTLRDLKVVLVGCGAAGTAIAESLLAAGVRDLVVFDLHGALTDEPGVALHHASIAARSNPRGVATLSSALNGADLFVGTSRRGSVQPELLSTMAEHPLIFALANPEPEVFAEELKGNPVIATGRSDFPNQINNSLCFPGFFKGALAARAGYVTERMKEAATLAIAGSVTNEELSVGVIVPSMFQPRVHEQVAAAVAAAWSADHPEGQSPPGAGATEPTVDDDGLPCYEAGPV
jgi:malate dehydrogenase (oxaloacetate-decarboxylating)